MSEKGVVAIPGLTMRDWIAMQVLSALIDRGLSLENPEDVGSEAYRVADGVLRARTRLLDMETQARIDEESSPEVMERRRSTMEEIFALNKRR